MSEYVLAEFNVAPCLPPLYDLIMTDFIAYRGEINKLAEAAPVR